MKSIMAAAFVGVGVAMIMHGAEVYRARQTINPLLLVGLGLLLGFGFVLIDKLSQVPAGWGDLRVEHDRLVEQRGIRRARVIPFDRIRGEFRLVPWQASRILEFRYLDDPSDGFFTFPFSFERLVTPNVEGYSPEEVLSIVNGQLRKYRGEVASATEVREPRS